MANHPIWGEGQPPLAIEGEGHAATPTKTCDREVQSGGVIRHTN